MIYIESNDAVNLDKRFHETHNICVMLYDQILEVANSKSMIKTDMELNEVELAEFNELKTNPEFNTLQWVEIKGKNEKVADVITKEFVNPLIADLLSFLYHSLDAARIGNITVAYSLLRKPFSDDLILLEQFLVRNSEIVKKVYKDGTPGSYDPSPKKMSVELRMTIIAETLKVLGIHYPFSAKVIFDLRYNKGSGLDLYARINKALHIVTMDEKYLTRKGELNFALSKEDHEKHVQHYYDLIPLLIIYSAVVIDRLVLKLTRGDEYLFAFRELFRIVSIAYWIKNGDKISLEDANEMVQKISNELICKCEKCKTTTLLVDADFKLFLREKIFLCKECASQLLGQETFMMKVIQFVRVD